MSKMKKAESAMQSIPDTDDPLLDYINHQQMLKDNELISDEEKQQMVQDEQIRIDNDIKGCYITFNFMFYGLIILMLIPVTFIFRDFTITEIFNFYGMYAVFGRNIVIIPLAIMLWMWQTAKKKDVYHPSTIKMKRKFKWIFIITLILVVVSLIVFGTGLKDFNI